MTPLGPHLTVFLREYLPNQREMSVQTSDTYAYAFQLLVCFAAERLKVTPSELTVEQLDATLVLAFLEHLEKTRENCARTRNSRLAASKTFFKFLEYRLPTCLEQIRRVRAIPVKKTDEVIVGYLNREEIQALLDTPDPSRRDGIRDRAMLHLAYAGGLRVSELVGLKLADLTLHPQPSIHVMGKGRRERILPLWKETASTIRELAQSPRRPERHGALPQCSRRPHDQIRVQIHSGEASQNSQREAAFAGEETCVSAHPEARLRNAHPARHGRYSKSRPVARPCKPSEHGSLLARRSCREVGDDGIVGSAQRSARPIPPTRQATGDAAIQTIDHVMRRPEPPNRLDSAVALWRLHITMDGAYFLRSTDSMATRMRICGAT